MVLKGACKCVSNLRPGWMLNSQYYLEVHVSVTSLLHMTRLSEMIPRLRCSLAHDTVDHLAHGCNLGMGIIMHWELSASDRLKLALRGTTCDLLQPRIPELITRRRRYTSTPAFQRLPINQAFPCTSFEAPRIVHKSLRCARGARSKNNMVHKILFWAGFGMLRSAQCAT